MPHWSGGRAVLGVFTVDNLDYVRRDAQALRGCRRAGGRRASAPLRVHRAEGDAYELGLGAGYVPDRTALRCTSRSNWTCNSSSLIDLDLREVFGLSVRALVGDASPADALSAYATSTRRAPPPRRRCGPEASTCRAPRVRATGMAMRPWARCGAGSCSGVRGGARRRRCAPSTRRARSRRTWWRPSARRCPGRSPSTSRSPTCGRRARTRPMATSCVEAARRPRQRARQPRPGPAAGIRARRAALPTDRRPGGLTARRPSGIERGARGRRWRGSPRERLLQVRTRPRRGSPGGRRCPASTRT